MARLLPAGHVADRMQEKGQAISERFSQWTEQTRHTRLKVTARHSVLEGAPGQQPAEAQSGCSSVNCESREHGGQSLSHCAGVTSSAHIQLCCQGPEHSSSCLHNKHLTYGVESSSRSSSHPSTEGRTGGLEVAALSLFLGSLQGPDEA